MSVSLTVTVQVEGTPSATADGEQTTAVAVARAVAVRFSEPLLGAHPGAPLAPAYAAERAGVPGALGV